MRIVLVFVSVLVVLMEVPVGVKGTRHRMRKAAHRYPKDTEFWASDFWVTGCKNFIYKCPRAYKSQIICARNYDGDYKTFVNYCFMQYENCNSWKNWRVFKREKC